MTAAFAVEPGQAGLGRAVRRHLGVAVPAIVAAGIVAAASVAVIAHMGSGSIGYAATSTRAALVVLAGGCGLVAAGIARYLQDPESTVGPLSALVGVCWLAASWVAWTGGPALARSAAAVVSPLLLALLLHLALSLPRNSIDGWRRPLVAAGYVTTAILSVGLALVRDPFRDRYCWDNCGTNSFLVHHSPALAHGFAVGWWSFSVTIGSIVAVVAGGMALTVSATTRRRVAPPAVAIAAIGAATAIHGLLRLADPAEHPTSTTSLTIFSAIALSLVGLAGAELGIVTNELRTRRAVRRLAGDLAFAPATGTLQEVLARTLGDPTLTVAYRLSDHRTSVAATGEPVDPRPSTTRLLVPIERDGECIAVVLVDRAASSSHDIGREIGSAARLAVDNERLRAQSLAQLAALRSSRLRIVEAADATRRRLERDLHDGAQQRLLALTYQVGLAIDDARDDGDDALRSTLEAAAHQVDRTFNELRDLAHGLHPVVLSEAGLGPALDSFADTTPLAISISGIPTDRFPERVERAAYLTVVRCAEEARERAATQLRVSFGELDDQLTIDIDDDGTPQRNAVLANVADRLGALGGSIIIGTNSTRAVIPCA